MKFLILWKENGQQWQVLPEQNIEEFLGIRQIVWIPREGGTG